MELKDCLSTTVGLTENDCPCDEADRPVDYNTSDSGWFIDDLEEGIPIKYPKASLDCGQGSVWNILERARTEGLREFETDFAVLLSRFHKRKYEGYHGDVGDPKHSKALQITKPFVAIWVTPRQIKGGQTAFKGGSITSQTSGTATIEIRSSEDFFATPLISQLVTFPANQRHKFEFDLPKELDLVTEAGHRIQYFMIANTDGGFQPRNTKFNCGCSSSNKGWTRYIEAYGVTLDAISDLDGVANGETTFSKSSYSNGLSLNVSMICKEMDWLCTSTDYRYDPFSAVMAKCLQLYMINKVINFVLHSGEINVYTVIEREALYARRSRTKKLIEVKMGWLTNNIPDNATNCLLCGDSYSIQKRPLIV